MTTLGLAAAGLASFALIGRDRKLPALPVATSAPWEKCKVMSLSSVEPELGNIRMPGVYCIEHDFIQYSSTFGGHRWPPFDHSIFEIHGGDATIDMQGHKIGADANSHGVLSYSEINEGDAKRTSCLYGQTTRNIKVRNGIIDLSLGVGVCLTRNWDLMISWQKFDGPKKYDITNHIIENVVIRTRSFGVLIEGEGNIIRNCIIDSEGDAGIVLAGPNNILENNKIILREPLVPSRVPFHLGGGWDQYSAIMASRRVLRSAIVLRDSTGTRLSANTIEVEGASDLRNALYIGDASRNVVLEGNNFIGTSKIGFTGAAVTTIERDNKFSVD